MFHGITVQATVSPGVDFIYIEENIEENLWELISHLSSLKNLLDF